MISKSQSPLPRLVSRQRICVSETNRITDRSQGVCLSLRIFFYPLAQIQKATRSKLSNRNSLNPKSLVFLLRTKELGSKKFQKTAQVIKQSHMVGPWSLRLCPPRPQRCPLHNTAPGRPPYHIPHAWPLGIVEVSRLGTTEVIIPLCPFFYHLLLDPLHLPRRRAFGECSSSTRLSTT